MVKYLHPEHAALSLLEGLKSKWVCAPLKILFNLSVQVLLPINIIFLTIFNRFEVFNHKLF